ncbi:MAG: queuosine precursor transporter [Proteobacteria bacterium]|nr:queuosine precursor transporter [Pseudomonadota bacterium]
MQNVLLFLGSCGLIAAFAWYFSKLGQNALTALVAILSLLANLFVLKQIDFMGLNATASDAFTIGSLLGLNLLQEKYGKTAATSAIWTSFAGLVFFALMSQIHLLYQPSIYDQSQASYQFLLSPAPRILIASLLTFLIADQCDVKLYAFLRAKYPQISMIFISAISMSCSQLLDTVLFSLLGLYGVVQAIVEIIVVSYGIKLLAIANTIPWSFMTRRLLAND